MTGAETRYYVIALSLALLTAATAARGDGHGMRALDGPAATWSEPFVDLGATQGARVGAAKTANDCLALSMGLPDLGPTSTLGATGLGEQLEDFLAGSGPAPYEFLPEWETAPNGSGGPTVAQRPCEPIGSVLDKGVARNFQDLGSAGLGDGRQDCLVETEDRLGSPEMRLGECPTELGTNLVQELFLQLEAPKALSEAGRINEHADVKLTLGPCAPGPSQQVDLCYLPSVALVTGTGVIDVACSGVAIGPRHVLTARHCTCERPDYVAFGTGLAGALQFYREGGGGWTTKQAFGLRSSRLVGLDMIVPMLSRTGHDYCVTSNLADDEITLLVLDIPGALPFSQQAAILRTPELDTRVEIAGFGVDPDVDVRGNATRIEPRGEDLKRTLSARVSAVESRRVLVEGLNEGYACVKDSGSGAHRRLAGGGLGVFGILSRGPSLLGEVVGCGSGWYLRLDDEDRLAFLAKHVPDAALPLVPALVAQDSETLCLGLMCQ